jgi:hypothetical protein
MVNAMKEAPRQETLSQQARTFLVNRGYSQQFIAALEGMLRDCASTMSRPGPRREQSAQESMWSPEIPGQVPVERMPGRMGDEFTNETTYKGRRIIMPDIGSYAPNTKSTPSIYRNFASAEGQRFMQRYFRTGWLQRDSSTGEWILRLPVPLSQAVPRRP